MPKAYVYPADVHGCGYYRLIWPAQELQRRGYDVDIVMPETRKLTSEIVDGRVTRVHAPDDADVMVIQRPTHRFLAQGVAVLRRQGIRVVVDMDDDLSRIHPRNPAWREMHPDPELKVSPRMRDHSWTHALEACEAADLVTLSSSALIARYARHGRVRVLRNCVPDSFLDVSHRDSDSVGWPATLHSHPDDPEVVGGGVARALDELGLPLTLIGDGELVARAFGVRREKVVELGLTEFSRWPLTVTKFGVGLAPLADTTFNAAKSWLKPLEMAACGVPCVMSPRVEYQRIHHLGVGLLARRPNDWYRHIKALASSSSLREELSLRGRDVAREWTFSRRAESWAQAWFDGVD